MSNKFRHIIYILMVIFFHLSGALLAQDTDSVFVPTPEDKEMLARIEKMSKEDPNAIVPDGVNTIFKPVLIYGTEEGYNMKIFNRYGEVIFETDDVNEGWDGTYNNKTVEMGAYAYLITFIASNGQVITKKGNVTVVR